MARGSRSRGATRTQAARARAPPPERPERAHARLLRALAAHPHLTAGALLALLVLVLLWPALVGGQVLSPAAVLYKVTPWQPYQPHDVASFENYLLADVPLVLAPWREFARQLIHQGTFPAWNPGALSGVPFVTQPGMFSPFSLPHWILPFDYSFGVTAALQLWSAGFGTYLLVRELRLGFLPGLLAGVAYGFCSMQIMWLTSELLTAVAALLPWMLWLIERTFARGRPGSALGLAVATAIALGGGHPGTQVHVMAAAGLYALLRALLPHDVPRRERMVPLASALGGLALGTLLMAVLMLPETLSSHGTIGTIARKGGASTLPGAKHMPFETIRTILFPDWWGRPSAFETDDSPVKTMFLNYQERTFYAGVVSLLIACVALAGRRAWQRKAPFVVLGVLALAITLHTPGLFQFVEHLPVIELVENQRLHFVFELAIAVLAAFGLQDLIERPQAQRRRRLAVIAVAVGVALIAAAGAIGSAANVGHVMRHFLTGADTATTAVVELTSATWLLLLALGSGIGLLALRRWPRRRHAIAGALVLLAALDLLHFANGYEPMGPASKVMPPRTPAIAYLQRHKHAGRFVGLGLALPPDTALRWGLADVRGYDPPYPTLRYFELWREASPEQDNWRPLTIGEISPVALRVTGVLGARYVVADPGTEKPRDADPSVRTLRRVYAARDATIFENPDAVPRTLVASAVRLVGGANEARATIVERGFDPRRAVVAERDEPGTAALASAAAVQGSVAIAHDDNARVTLRARLDRRGLVVLNDQFTDGWSVRVDGRPAQALHVDDVMRGVVVGAGRHEIVWSYTVPGLRAGALLSALGLVVAVAAALLLARRRRRAR